MAEPARQGLTGRVLGEFVVREPIGEGAFGSVYRAEQPALGREVVIKILHDRLVSHREANARFIREARLASQLEHPYAAHVYACGAEPDGLHWIAMELVRGTPLSKLLTTRTTLTLDELVPFITDLCEVVHTAHELGIVHRDIKPANVMVMTRAGRWLPKLLDFGIARGVAPEVSHGAITAVDDTENTAPIGGDDGVTQAGVTLGSPAYMAPEQWIDPASVDGRADIYSLGVLAFRALAGHVPFTTTNMTELFQEVRSAPVPSLVPDVSPEVDAVVRKALAKRADERYQTALDFAAALRTAAGVESRELLPALDEQLRDQLLRDAPRPLAEAVALLGEAESPHQMLAAAGQVMCIALRLVALIAVAARDHKLSRDQLARLRNTMTEAEWLALAKDLLAPYAREPELFAMPELPRLFFEHPDWLRAAEAAVDDPQIAAAALASPSVARTALVRRLGQLATVLRGLELFAGSRIAVPADAGDPIAYSGVRRAGRIAVERPLTAPAIVDRYGRVVVDLASVTRFASPVPDAPKELFLLEGRGRHGARLLAWPSRFELHDSGVWRQLGLEVSRDDSPDDGVPYPGLRPFTVDEATRFFGREREAEAFRNRMLVEPLLAVVGPSGSGKSSFVIAGVLGELRDGWRGVVFRPGADPLAGLATVSGDKVVIVVDQFEELFTQCRDAAARTELATRLVALSKEPDHRVILVLRDDFLFRAAQLDRAFARAIQILGTPAREELRRILVAPAARVDYHFEDDALVDEIVDAVAGTDGGLALLAFTAARLWEHRDQQRKLLTRDAYRALGGVGGALANHADETLAALPPAQRALAREAFRRLVTVEGTRATFGRDELIGALGGGDDALAVVERLVDARLLLASDRDDGAHVEIVHEVLVTAWPQLAAWRAEDVEGTRMLDQVRAAAQQWEAHERSPGLLWRGDPWTELAAWHARHPTAPLSAGERAFVGACRREAVRRRTWLRGIIATSAIIAIGVIGTLYWANRRAASSAADAKAHLVAAWRERGRQDLLEGRAASALPWLVAVADAGHDDPALRFLIGRAVEALSHRGPVLAGHHQQVRTVTFLDATHVASGSDDGKLIAWDLTTSQPVRTLDHGAPVVAIAHEGEWIATAGGNRVRMWNGTGMVWESNLNVAVDVKFLDGKLAMYAQESHDLVFRDLASGTETHVPAVIPWQHIAATRDKVAAMHDDRLTIFDRDGNALASAPPHGNAEMIEIDATRIAVAYDDHVIRVYDHTGKLLHELVGHHDLVRTLVFSHDGAHLLSTSIDRTAKVWDLATGTTVFSLADRDSISRGLYSPDGTLLVTISGDSTVRLWDARDGTPLLALEGHVTTVTSAAFSADGKRLVTGSWDATARIWDVTSLPIATSIAPRDDRAIRLWTARISNDGTRISTVDRTGAVKLWDATTGAHVRSFDTPKVEMYSAAFSPTGDRIATGAFDQRARIYRVSDGALVATMEGHTAHVWSAEFSPDGTKLVTASWDKTAAIWDASTGKRLHVLAGHTDVLWQALFSPDGTLVATASDDGTAKLWDVATGREVATLAGHVSGIGTVAFSPDGKRLVTGSRDLTAKVWDIATRRVLTTLAGHTNAINAAYWAYDGAFIITAGYDGRTRVFDSERGALLAVLDTERTPSNSAEPSRDGRFVLASGSFDERVKLWRVDLRHERPDPAVLKRLLDCRYRDCAGNPALESKR